MVFRPTARITTTAQLMLPGRGLPLRRWMPFALFAVACALSLGASWYVSATHQAQVDAQRVADHERLRLDADRIRQQIQFRLDSYVEIARAAGALIGASSEIPEPDFRAFVRGLQLGDHYPGMAGIGFAARVPHDRHREFLNAVSLDTGRGFQIRPSGTRSEYYPILFLEPTDTTTSESLGFDLSTEPDVWEAMERAHATGQPASSSLLRSPPFGQPEQATSVLVIPVYHSGSPSDTVSGRDRDILGFVFSPLHAEQMLAPIAANTTPALSLQVVDASDAARTPLLTDSADPTDDATFRSSGSVRAAGRQWSVFVRSLEAPPGDRPAAVLRTLLTGLLLSALLFAITLSQVRAWERTARQEVELRASALALRESEAQLQAADRAKDEFLATLSHELRTPLNAILGWVTMLRRGSIGEDRHAHGLEVIERNARLQTHLIEDLLDVSRIVMGKVRLQMRPLPIAAVVAAAVESLRPGADAKCVDLNMALLDDATIHGDSDRIQQIVWNLVANAVKFTPAGGRVHVELRRDGQHAQIAVRDTGIGIDAAFIPHVFERFRQADSSTTRPHSGIGIGLAIVQHLVELHGGAIEVRSEGRDHGSEFLVRLPLAAAPVGPRAGVFPVGMRPPGASSLEGIRVLVVDDDADTRELLTEVLGTLGAMVTAVASAPQAIERLSAHGADVVVSDIAMPDEDGLSLIRRIRRLPEPLARVPAIALTAFARAGDRDRVFEAGYQLHLAKPVEIADLQAGLSTLAFSREPRAHRAEPADTGRGPAATTI